MTWMLGTFVARLSMDSSGFTSGVAQAEDANARLGVSLSNVRNVAAGVGAAVAAMAAGVAVAASAQLNLAESIDRVAQSTGASTDTVQTLRAVLEAAGLSAETADAGLAKFADTLGGAQTQGGPAVEVLKRLGISLGEIQADDASIVRVLEALAAIENPAQRAAAATDLFGRSAGPRLANAVAGAGGSVSALTQQFSEMGVVIGGGALNGLLRLDSQVDKITQRLTGLKNTALNEFLRGAAGGFDSASESAEKMSKSMESLGRFANDLGNAVAALVDILKFFVDNPVVQWLNSAREWLVDVYGTGLADTLADLRGDMMNSQELARPYRPPARADSGGDR